MPTKSFDVVVVGGGASGVAAAVAAARCGARAALVERYGFLGGAGTNASVSTLDGFFDQTGRQVVGGIGDEVLQRLIRRRSGAPLFLERTGNTVVPFDREALKIILDDVLDEAGVVTLLHAQLVGARTSGRQVASIDLAHRGGIETLDATAFVDCSGDGALLAAAGAGYLVPPADQRQKATLVAIISGVDPEADYAKADLVAAIQRNNAETGDDLHAEAAFALFNRFSGDVMLFVGDEQVDALDLLSLSGAERHARRAISRTVAALRAQLRGWENAKVSLTGPQIGLREVRRLQGRQRILGATAVSGRIPADTIALAGWPIEDHSGDRPRYVSIRDRGSFGIPYGAVVSATHDNLWAAGRLVSSDSEAFCSIRVMATGFATGQAAGIAAALVPHTDGPADAAVINELKGQGALL